MEVRLDEDMLITGVSGIRGIVGRGLGAEEVLRFSTAFARRAGGKIVIGRDSRQSGEMFAHAAIAGVLAAGCEAVDAGICPTPTAQLAVMDEQASGGLVITASHNPVEWNGLKMIGPDGIFLDKQAGAEVLRLYEDGRGGEGGAWMPVRPVSSLSGAVDRHLQRTLSLGLIEPRAIRDRGFKVVVDCVNGAGGVIVPQLLMRLGCTVVVLNGCPNGLFAHRPEPLAENLGDLCGAVQEHGADLGLAVDPDVDRLALVSEAGKMVGEEYTVTLAARFVLGKRPGPVVVNLSTTRMIDDVAAEAGVPVDRTPVGEVYVARRMRELGASVGGEGNGGVILPDVHLGRDAPIGTALLLSSMAESGASLSDLVASVPSYVMAKRRVDVSGMNTADALARLRAVYAGEAIDERDGIKIVRDRSWLHVRPSNTEPILRIFAEAETRLAVERWCDEVELLVRGPA